MRNKTLVNYSIACYDWNKHGVSLGYKFDFGQLYFDFGY